MRNNGFFSKSVAAIVAVVMLSIGIGASAMVGIESVAASGNGSSLSCKKVKVGNFDKIEIDGLVAVEYRQGNFPGYIELETLPEFMDNFDAKVKDGKLELGCNVNTNKSNLKFVAKITAPQLKEVDMEGVTSFKVDGPLSFGEEFLLKTEGVNTVSFGEVTGGVMKITTRGVATIYMISAELQSLNIISDGVSDMRLKGLNVDHINAIVHSASNIVLGGRCRSLSKTENKAGKIDTKGLIVESASRQSAPQPSSSGQTMPRIP